MLPYLFRGPHLYREDAYREYCWSVDVYSAYQPASFIYLCFEAFRDYLLERRVRLDELVRPESTRTRDIHSIPTKRLRNAWGTELFFGAVTRIRSVADADLVESMLARGRNVIALLPNELNSLHGYMCGTDGSPTTEQLLDRLDLSPFISRLRNKVMYQGEVWWDEVPTQSGRLFVTEDSFLSDAYFFEGYGYTEENHRRLLSLGTAFAVHSKPLLLVECEVPSRAWPCHEPLAINLQIRNFGPRLSDIRIAISVNSGYEAIALTEFNCRNIDTLSEITLTTQLIPRRAGRVSPIEGVRAWCKDVEIELSFQPPILESSGSLRNATLSTAPQDAADLSFLSEKISIAPTLIDLKNIVELAQIDLEACLNKIRKTAEALAFGALSKLTRGGKNRITFNDCIHALHSTKKFSARTIGYLHTIRIVGNLASHATDVRMADGDVRVAAYALASIIDEFQERKML